ncbi:MAG: hypothetical protein WCK55_18010 [Verrucomicrobiota bacterium]
MKAPQRPIIGLLLFAVFFIIGVICIIWGAVDLSQSSSYGIIVFGVAFVAFSIYWWVETGKGHKTPIVPPGVGLPKLVSKRFGILVPGEGRPNNGAIAGMIVCPILAIMPLASSTTEKGDNGLLYSILWSAFCVAGFFYFLSQFRGSQSYRSGIRKSSGVLWEIERKEIIAGRFETKMSHREYHITAIEMLSSKGEGKSKTITGKPELDIVLSRSPAGSFQIDRVRLGGVTAFTLGSEKTDILKLSCIEVVADDEVATVLCRYDHHPIDWLFSELRRIAVMTKETSEGGIPVNLLVEDGRGSGSSFVEGLNTSAMTGYALARIAGGAGVAGAVIGALMTGSRLVISQGDISGQKELRSLIFGDENTPAADNLCRIAAEFGWVVLTSVRMSNT